MEDIGTALAEIIKNEKLQDVTKELTEFSIDALLKDGLLKEFPIIGTLTGFFKASTDIKDKLFLKKITSFLLSLDSNTAEERQKMINEIDTSAEYSIKVGEKLMYIIDKCDDHQKAEIIGCLFNRFLKAKISYDDFLLCCSIVENCIVKDLIGFTKDDNKYYKIQTDAELLNWGLLAIINVQDEQILLKASKGGLLLKSNLIDYTENQISKLGLRKKSVAEIEDYFRTIFSKYSANSRWRESKQSISEATIELCNNYIITDDDFNNLMHRVHMQSFGLFEASSDYIENIQKRENFSNNDFNQERWKKYESFFSWNAENKEYETYERPK